MIIGIVLSALFVFGLLTAGIWLLLRSANETVHMPVETTAASTAETIPDTDLSAVDIFELISPSVVEITTESSSGGGIGTGFFCDDKGTVITNYHVIRDRQKAWITLSDGRTYSVTSVLGYDADRDLAVLATGCTDRSIDGGYYCENHTCKFDGCTNSGLFNGYCYGHSS